MIPQHPLPPNGLVGKQISVSDRILTRVVTGTHRRLLRLTRGRLMNSMVRPGESGGFYTWDAP